MEENKNPLDEKKDSALDSTTNDQFDTTKLDEKSEGGTFQVSTKYKWVLALSILLVLIEGVLIYAFVEGALAAEIWQTAIWGIGVLVALYSIVKKSLAATLFNLILFVGVSLIPAWGMVYEFFKPVIDLFIP